MACTPPGKVFQGVLERQRILPPQCGFVALSVILFHFARETARAFQIATRLGVSVRNKKPIITAKKLTN
jgi:hypothetical protein